MKPILAILLIGLALLARLLPHPENFTPVLAVALFGGAMLRRGLAYFVPVTAMAASDLALGMSFTPTSAVVYACFVLAVPAGRWLGRGRTWSKTMAGTLTASVAFFALTNLAVWLFEGLYPHTWDGLLDCYAMGLPFFRNSLAGDVFWVVALFGSYDLAAWRATRRRATG